jgi:hypothetical protein
MLSIFRLLCRRTPPPQTAREPVAEAGLSDKQITQSFLAAIPRITRQLNLEIATSTQTEVFERTQGKTVLWGALEVRFADESPTRFTPPLRLTEDNG